MDALISRLRLRHFRLVHAIADCGQLSIAANRLATSQPAASRTLSEIERLVGEPLFERNPKGMAPTPLGQVVIRHAGKLLSDLEATAEDVDAFRHGRAGTVRVGAVTGPAVRFVVPAVQKLKDDAWQAEVSVDVAPSVELMAGLLRGDYDMALCRVPSGVDSRALDIHRGRVEEIRLLTRAGHPLLRRRQLRLADLSGMTWVVQGVGMPIRDAIEQAFTNRNIPVPRDTVNTASLLVALSYLRSTDAVAAITREVVELIENPESGGWGTLDMGEAIILQPYHLITLRERPMTPVCRRLYGLLKRELSGDAGPAD